MDSLTHVPDRPSMLCQGVRPSTPELVNARATTGIHHDQPHYTISTTRRSSIIPRRPTLGRICTCPFICLQVPLRLLSHSPFMRAQETHITKASKEGTEKPCSPLSVNANLKDNQSTAGVGISRDPVCCLLYSSYPERSIDQTPLAMLFQTWKHALFRVRQSSPA